LSLFAVARLVGAFAVTRNLAHPNRPVAIRRSEGVARAAITLDDARVHAIVRKQLAEQPAYRSSPIQW
jgi:hypothetical protein